jgi:hypothetical protein
VPDLSELGLRDLYHDVWPPPICFPAIEGGDEGPLRSTISYGDSGCDHRHVS